MRNLLFILIALCVLFTYTASAASHTKGHSKHKSVAHHHNKHSPKKHHTPAHHSTGKKKKTTKKVTKKTSKKGSKKSTTKKTPTTHAHQKAYPKHKIVAYVLDWDTPKNIAWNKLDHIVYAFAEPNAKGDLKNFDGNNLKKRMLHIDHDTI